MAETKTKKPSTSKVVDTATKREQLVKKVSEEQKASAKKNTIKKTTTKETTVSRDVVREKSLEQKYLEKFQAEQKKQSSSKTKTATKSTTTKKPSTTTDKASTKSTPKTTETKVVKAPTGSETESKDVRVGNVVVDEKIAKTKVGMQQSKKDKQKNLAIGVLSALLAIVVIVSLVFVLTNLNKKDIAELKVEGSGAEWIINGKERNSFTLAGGSEVQPGCTINIKLELQKTTNSPINVRIRIQSFKNDTELRADFVDLYKANSSLVMESTGVYVLQNWNASSGTLIKISEGFDIGFGVGGIDNDNFSIKVTATIY